MAPGPTLAELITSTETDVAGGDALDLLAEASRTAAEMEQIGDALVGHFVDQCRRAGHTWAEISTSLGVTKQAVHKRFSLGSPSFERFTGRARVALKGARDAARARNEAFVGTEHILLALFDDSQALSAQVLTEAGLTRQKCEAEFAPDRSKFAAQPAQERIPWTPKAADVLRSAVTEALAMGHNYIGTEHLLLGLFQVPEGLGCKILVTLRTTEEDVRHRVAEKLKGYTSPQLTDADLPTIDDEA